MWRWRPAGLVLLLLVALQRGFHLRVPRGEAPESPSPDRVARLRKLAKQT